MPKATVSKPVKGTTKRMPPKSKGISKSVAIQTKSKKKPPSVKELIAELTLGTIIVPGPPDDPSKPMAPKNPVPEPSIPMSPMEPNLPTAMPPPGEEKALRRPTSGEDIDVIVARQEDSQRKHCKAIVDELEAMVGSKDKISISPGALYQVIRKLRMGFITWSLAPNPPKAVLDETKHEIPHSEISNRRWTGYNN